MRASDILMDRVWQLENETLKDTAGFVFARITDVVEPDQDPTAPHPEIQRRLPGIRTDLDRFSPLEINCLVQHGYCVARKACRDHPEVFGTAHPAGPRWVPKLDTPAAPVSTGIAAITPEPVRGPIEITRDARTLHSSSVRRIWSSLLDYRDWTSYIYVPIIVPILVLLPYFAMKYYERSHRINQIVESLAQGSRDVEQMTRLLEGPIPPWTGESAEELPPQDIPNVKGFTILQDLRMIDLRKWKSSGNNDANSYVYGDRRLKVRRDVENLDNHSFRVSVLAISPATHVRFPPQQLKPKLYSRNLDQSGRAERQVHWEIGTDLQKVPAGESVDIIYEHHSPGLFLRDGIGSTTLKFEVEVETIELTRWLLMPKGKEYESFQIIRYKTGKPEVPKKVKVVTEFLAEDRTILAFKLLALKPGYTHEITWFYK